MAMVVLAHAGFASPGAECRIEAVVPEPHLRVEWHAARHDAATGTGTFLPIVHVVLLKRSRRAESAHPGQADLFFDVGRCGFVDKYPRPYFGLVRPTRVPDPEGARSRAQ